jgi:hypothetical protein
MAAGGLLRAGHLQVIADFPAQEIVEFAVTRDR